MRAVCACGGGRDLKSQHSKHLLCVPWLPLPQVWAAVTIDPRKKTSTSR